MKILLLENESVMDDDQTNIILSYFVKKGYESQIIEHAYQQDPQYIVKSVQEADIILFQTTWLRPQQIIPIGKLLAADAVEPKEIYCFSIDSRSMSWNMEQTFDLGMLVLLAKHSVREIKTIYFDEGEEWYEEVDMSKYVKKWEQKEKERIEKNNSFNTTGFKIKIKEIQANGTQWSELKEGDIVDELDCSSIDPNPNRGVWVMGKDEPVKLLNSDGYDEFEFAETKAWALAKDFLTRGNKKQEVDVKKTIVSWINSNLPRLDDAEIWLWADEMCDLCGVQRRGNRHYFDRRLKEYRDEYKNRYFSELDKISLK